MEVAANENEAPRSVRRLAEVLDKREWYEYFSRRRTAGIVKRNREKKPFRIVTISYLNIRLLWFAYLLIINVWLRRDKVTFQDQGFSLAATGKILASKGLLRLELC